MEKKLRYLDPVDPKTQAKMGPGAFNHCTPKPPRYNSSASYAQCVSDAGTKEPGSLSPSRAPHAAPSPRSPSQTKPGEPFPFAHRRAEMLTSLEGGGSTLLRGGEGPHIQRCTIFLATGVASYAMFTSRVVRPLGLRASCLRFPFPPGVYKKAQ